ncbi:hypothetical protein R70006_08294 [Paraburkholderia domus]|nr:hypothetical protein R70006_08294 [Paraburkholderia domus]CAE6969070.1 hypothetical protein R75471_07327 [Paraburkholderia domus]
MRSTTLPTYWLPMIERRTLQDRCGNVLPIKGMGGQLMNWE